MTPRDTEPKTLGTAFAHLLADGSIQTVPVDDRFWSEGIGTLPPGRLVSVFESTADWTSWEMHPNGDEFVMLLSGRLTLLFDADGERWSEEVRPGEFVVIPKGVWHTANVREASKVLFVTTGDATEHCDR